MDKKQNLCLKKRCLVEAGICSVRLRRKSCVLRGTGDMRVARLLQNQEDHPKEMACRGGLQTKEGLPHGGEENKFGGEIPRVHRIWLWLKIISAKNVFRSDSFTLISDCNFVLKCHETRCVTHIYTSHIIARNPIPEHEELWERACLCVSVWKSNQPGPILCFFSAMETCSERETHA